MDEWYKQQWAVYDLETTGTDPATARVVQVAVAIIDDQDREIRSRFALCDPGKPIPKEASEIHGITDADVEGKKPDTKVLSVFAKWMRKFPVIVTYNGSRYDDLILRNRTGLDLDKLWAGKTRIDVLTLIKMDKIGRWWKGKSRHRLGTVAEQFGIQASGQLHDAEVDCRLTGQALAHLVEHPEYGHIVRKLPTGDAGTQAIQKLSEQQEQDYLEWRRRQR